VDRTIRLETKPSTTPTTPSLGEGSIIIPLQTKPNTTPSTVDRTIRLETKPSPTPTPSTAESTIT